MQLGYVDDSRLLRALKLYFHHLLLFYRARSYGFIVVTCSMHMIMNHVFTRVQPLSKHEYHCAWRWLRPEAKILFSHSMHAR